jgi:predicted metal-dependent phosphoesterase TrpH
MKNKQYLLLIILTIITSILNGCSLVAPTSIDVHSSIGDLHIHTICSDGKGTYEQMINKALILKYNFIAITDHRYQGQGGPCGVYNHDKKCDDLICNANIEKCKNESRLLCIPGQEVTGRLHVIALGISEGINENLPIIEIVNAIHKQGGIAIAAHPSFSTTALTEEPRRFTMEYTETELYQSGFDAKERCKSKADNRLPCIKSSDAHAVEDMGLFGMKNFSICEGIIKSFEELKAAIIGGKCKPALYGE